MATRRIVTSAQAAANKPAPVKTPGKVVDLPAFLKQLDDATGDGRMAKVTSMLKADRFQLFSEVTDSHVTGVVKSQTDASLFYACKIESGGRYMCCTQNLNVCGGLRGKPCKHLLVLMVGLASAGQADSSVLSTWVRGTKNKKAELDKDSMSATFIKYKGAEAGEVDWRPTETIPEDYYAL
jgi:hypothetical protein